MKVTIVHADVKVEYEDSNARHSAFPDAIHVIKSLGELVMLIKNQRDETKKENRRT